MKKSKNKFQLSSKAILFGVVTLALVGIFFYVKNNLMVSPQVALISDSALCTSNLEKFSVKDECSPGTFSSYSSTCKNGETNNKVSTSGCFDYFSAYLEAQNLCGKTCTALPVPSTTPTPKPSVTPSPTKVPSVTPYPTFTAYPTSTSYPTTTATPRPSDPPACYAQELTHFAYRGNCTTPTATEQSYNFIDYTCGNETTPRTMGSAESCQFERSLKSGAEFYCRKNACNVATSGTPSPTSFPTSNPTTNPGCYTQTPFCLSKLVGGACPVQIICPSTTPSPTRYPTPTSISTLRPSSTAVASRTPSPTYTTTPPPTSDPSPLVSCETEVYKLPAKLDINNLNSITLAQYKVKSNNILAKAGERYAFNMNLTNIKNYPLTNGNLSLSAWSSNSQGESSPYRILKVGPSCQSYPDKTIRCGVSQIYLSINQSVRPDTYMVVDINPAQAKSSMSIGYQGIYSASNVSCPTVNLTVQGLPVQKCFGYGWAKLCRTVYPN